MRSLDQIPFKNLTPKERAVLAAFGRYSRASLPGTAVSTKLAADELEKVITSLQKKRLIRSRKDLYEVELTPRGRKARDRVRASLMTKPATFHKFQFSEKNDRDPAKIDDALSQELERIAKL